jgi:hypothetical protein
MTRRRNPLRRSLPGALSVWLLLGVARLSLAGEGGCWTNRAGQVLRGMPVSLRGQSVAFSQEGSGKVVTCPLSVFAPEEQERVRGQLKDATPPEGLRSAYDFSGRVILRSRLLRENGSLTEEACRKAVGAAADAFRRQAAPFVENKQLSAERLELIVRRLTETPK